MTSTERHVRLVRHCLAAGMTRDAASTLVQRWEKELADRACDPSALAFVLATRARVGTREAEALGDIMAAEVAGEGLVTA